MKIKLKNVEKVTENKSNAVQRKEMKNRKKQKKKWCTAILDTVWTCSLHLFTSLTLCGR